MNLLNTRMKHIEKATGLTEKQIKEFSPDELRSHLEKRNDKKLSIVSEFPTIGRGNALRDNLITHSRINKEIDKILGGIHNDLHRHPKSDH